MKNIRSMSLLIVLIISYMSCQKESALDAVLPQFRKLEKVATMSGLTQMLNDASGSIGVTNMKPFGTEATQAEGGISEVKGRFFEDGQKITFGTLDIDDFSLTPGEYGYYYSSPDDRLTVQNNFGDTKVIQLSESEEASEQHLINESIYLPKEIYVHDPVQRGTDRINQSAIINWNPDAQNENGVFILIDFLPEGVENEGRFTTSFASHRKIIYTEDDGMYQLKSSDFNEMPSGAYLSFLVGRGDYAEVIGSNDKSYILYSFTGAMGSFFVDAVSNGK